MSEPLAYLEGRFLEQSALRLPLHDAGFVFGATVTDLCRTFHHQLFRLSDHLARFRCSCQAAHVPQAVPDAELVAIAERLVAHNVTLLKPDEDLALVLLATPGPIGYYAGLPGGAGDAPPTLALHTFPLPFARYHRLFSEGAHLVVPPTRHLPPECVDPGIKQRSRLHWWIADRQAQQLEPGAWALLVGPDGGVTETAAANFLIVRGGRVISPPRSRILDGISLRVTEELCQANGIPFAEAFLTVEDCLAADEALITGTAFCLAGVRSINGSALSWPGPVTQTLTQAWTHQIGLDYCGADFNDSVDFSVAVTIFIPITGM